MTMSYYELKGNSRVYYDYKQGIIGRKPSTSNFYETGSDNSLYLGDRKNENTMMMICNVFKLKNIEQFQNMEFNIQFYDRMIPVYGNINRTGQAQICFKENGCIAYIFKEFCKREKWDMGNLDVILYINFILGEGYFLGEVIDANERNKDIQEAVDILTELKDKRDEYDTNEEFDQFVESTLTLRNPQVQRRFRHNLFVEFDGKCALCAIKESALLNASHILAYSKCDNVNQMIDHNNGLLLCINHDALFDKGFITFDEEGKIEIVESDVLSPDLYELLNINKEMRLDKKFMNTHRIEYLRLHKLRK